MIRIEVFSFVPILLEFMVILKNVFNLKCVFEKKLSVWQILRNTFKSMKNHL